MQIISHQSQLNALPSSQLRNHIITKFDDLVETENDIPPIFIIVEEDDDLTGPDYAFVSSNGLRGDGDTLGTYEAIIHLPGLSMYELLFLVHGEDGYWILIPEDVVEAHPDLHWVLTDGGQGGLSDPQPL